MKKRIFCVWMALNVNAWADGDLIKYQPDQPAKVATFKEMADWKPRFSSRQELVDFAVRLGFTVIWQGTSTDHYAILFDTGDGRLGSLVYCTSPSSYNGSSLSLNTPHGSVMREDDTLVTVYKFGPTTEGAMTMMGATIKYRWGDIFTIDPKFKGPLPVEFKATDSRFGRPEVRTISTVIHWPLAKETAEMWIAPSPSPAAATP